MSALELAFAANAGLGAFLLALGVLIALASPDRTTRAPLGAFLGLVGANYLLDGLGHALGGGSLDVLRRAALVVTIADPPALLLFALAARHGPVGARTRALVLAPGALLLVLFALVPPEKPFLVEWPARWGQVAHLGLYYVMAFALLAERAAIATTPVLRDRYRILLVGFGLVTVSRLPLLLVDLGFLYGGVALPFAQILVLVALLGLLSAIAWALVRRISRPAANGLALLHALVGLVWLAGAIPPLAIASASLLYSIRWLVFAPLLLVGARRFDLLGLSFRAQRVAAHALTGAMLLAVAAQIGAYLLVTRASLTSAVAGALFLLVLLALAVAGLRRAVPPADERAASARATYRAHVASGASATEREDLRARLGLSLADAESIEAGIEGPGRGS